MNIIAAYTLLLILGSMYVYATLEISGLEKKHKAAVVIVWASVILVSIGWLSLQDIQ